ncbi:MAG: DUF1232 domain-containing protein [Pirellulales bacterium]|nr:DUF1232 domain-containing protein [Pirellulales bacterium]
MRPALELYYTARSPETPLSAKLQAGAALAYLILPLDLLPDVLAGVGYTDDVAALLATILALNAYISPAIREQAAAKAEALFGADVT